MNNNEKETMIKRFIIGVNNDNRELKYEVFTWLFEEFKDRNDFRHMDHDYFMNLTTLTSALSNLRLLSSPNVPTVLFYEVCRNSFAELNKISEFIGRIPLLFGVRHINIEPFEGIYSIYTMTNQIWKEKRFVDYCVYKLGPDKSEVVKYVAPGPGPESLKPSEASQIVEFHKDRLKNLEKASSDSPDSSEAPYLGGQIEMMRKDLEDLISNSFAERKKVTKAQASNELEDEEEEA